ncbi:hypothetical protein F2Q69_00031728 [Brassica cretica]|uniref:Uncharacterized protein n=1 Tax=Brassica cretica TaxID=69181 RepID=A0A8S9S3S1_BRACR|nr:hypothetical protein F2Q69_00031728 [Brassica cretica]
MSEIGGSGLQAVSTAGPPTASGAEPGGSLTRGEVRAEENDGEPVDDLALMRRAYTNKKTGQIDDGLVRDVVDLVQTQVVDEVSQLQTEDDASTASTNLSRFRINEIVESSVPKKKRRLVGLGRRSRSAAPSSAPPPYVDPEVLTAQLKDKDDRISVLETQMAAQQAGYETHKRLNEQMMEMMKRMYPNELAPEQPAFLLMADSLWFASGEDFVVFAGPMQVEIALHRDRQNMDRRYVEVFRCYKQDCYHAVAAEEEGAYEVHVSPPRAGPYREKSCSEKEKLEYTEVLKMRGLLYSANKPQIIEFFSGYKVVEGRFDTIAPQGNSFVSSFECANNSVLSKSRLSPFLSLNNSVIRLPGMEDNIGVYNSLVARITVSPEWIPHALTNS